MGIITLIYWKSVVNNYSFINCSIHPSMQCHPFPSIHSHPCMPKAADASIHQSLLIIPNYSHSLLYKLGGTLTPSPEPKVDCAFHDVAALVRDRHDHGYELQSFSVLPRRKEIAGAVVKVPAVHTEDDPHVIC